MTNSVCNYGQDSTRPPGPATDRYGDAHTSRFVRPLAGRATLISIDELVLVAQNVRAGAAAASVVGFCRWPRRTAGRGLGSLSPFGDGVDQSVVAALVASGMRRAGSTGRDRVTGIAATTTPRRNGDETETRLGSPAKGRQSPAAAGMGSPAKGRQSPAAAGMDPNGREPAAPGFPAHAGMDPRTAPASPARRRLPRTRGDGPPTDIGAMQDPMASPHTRGMDPNRMPGEVAVNGLPRTRGDGPGASCKAMQAT